ncbi:hypothetical protein HQ325_07045 [Rhodococcus sp. BP-349]|uniref:hypothetical protein n=1 Tax=unclassified Rhodococcus (in: high G+C Gram-positive bacteria) TaxID=192944 RepID=UPI001C9B31C5|nr:MULTISPECIES: hypothetical protein [unclassified Rhodococcus (in: high G+C Gram-positive bacteria)]MBY6538422.1 hypothetical protein [Rhodococcus sp. BP-363]MBY6542759.1 hypothetical protein [Rhodococcus sp. BP-369]MBY6561989.1 hypothetical protein [Rhodococcus sp. BP-370]MBY6576281.1 hypothetical protein [Rhodococcus sp. BP-364]MBY6585582.1 hypothetical protein [Rhodococcus sp. BP-358]
MVPRADDMDRTADVDYVVAIVQKRRAAVRENAPAEEVFRLMALERLLAERRRQGGGRPATLSDAS